jgi:sugar (pentulose or hexulose) kinase
MLSAAGSLSWLRDVTAPGVAFDDLVAAADGWEPGAEGLTFLPTWPASGPLTPTRTPAASSPDSP